MSTSDKSLEELVHGLVERFNVLEQNALLLARSQAITSMKTMQHDEVLQVLFDNAPEEVKQQASDRVSAAMAAMKEQVGEPAGTGGADGVPDVVEAQEEERTPSAPPEDVQGDEVGDAV